jgi:hypothetical protein
MTDIQKLIDERIQSFGDWRGEIVGKLIELVRNTDSSLVEEWKWDTLVWTKNGLVCAIGAFKDKVSLNFFKGALINDAEKFFNDGLEAKTSRRKSYFQGESIDGTKLKEIIKAAVRLNEK